MAGILLVRAILNHAVPFMLFGVFWTSHEPLLKQLHLDRIIMPQMFKANNVLADYARSYTQQRVNQYRSAERSVDAKDGYQDILTHLLDARDEETNSVYSENELLGEAILLLMAGSNTTATALTATMFYLAHHPTALGKLRDELHERFASANDIQVFEAENCKYLRACLDEAMRLYPLGYG
ncbi:cytochrome P450 [Thelonectria olida]|uniref:Cytochrome P450 n=1 Tax=Thelonectria olida TaxID=1576542 RepID=A0A9P9ANC2_9HYPO|nr:cytochrome P450 [Thelonectria olida]